MPVDGNNGSTVIRDTVYVENALTGLKRAKLQQSSNHAMAAPESITRQRCNHDTLRRNRHN